MTFKDIIDLTKNKIDETEEDAQISSIIKNAINYAYLLIATKIDKTVKNVDKIYSKIISLPEDFSSLVTLIVDGYELEKVDYEVKGNSIVVKPNLTGKTITIHYVGMPQSLVNDTDLLQVNDLCSIATSVYGAYSYKLSRGKVNEAQLLFNEFNLFLKSNGIDVEVDVNEPKRTN
jgi:hypothetical protein